MQAKFALAAAATLLSASVASGQEVTGDAAAGESVFRQCAACHNVVNDAGDVLARGVEPAVQQVLADGAVEEEGVL